MGRPKVLLTFPTSPANPYLHKHVVFASWRLLNDRRFDITPMIPSHNPLENNLNHIVKELIAGPWDFWLSIDNDNPPIKNPLDMVTADLDIVGFPTPVYHHTGKEKPGESSIYFNAYDYVSEEDAYRPHRPMEGLQSVDAIGGGCFLIARRVFEDKKMQRGAFLRKWNTDGTVDKGNDIAFSERARGRGFSIYADYDRPCMHFNEVELNEVMRAFALQYNNPAMVDHAT